MVKSKTIDAILLIIKIFLLKERYVDTYKEYTIEKTVLNNVRIEIENTLNDYIDLRLRVIKNCGFLKF
jgi:hypothetical protein